MILPLFSPALWPVVLLLLATSPLTAGSSCQDLGCSALFSGQGVCVDLAALSAAALGAGYDLAAGGLEDGCGCGGGGCDCRCFRRRREEERAGCPQSKSCAKKKGLCQKQGSAPKGSKDLGWCSKKSKCKCYKSQTAAPTTPSSSNTCQGRYAIDNPLPPTVAECFVLPSFQKLDFST